MAVTLNDVDKWDPNLIRDAFNAVRDRADAAADVHAHAVGIFGRHVEAGFIYSKFRSRHRKLDEAAHLLNFFFFYVVVRIEIFDFAGNATTETCWVEQGNGADSRFTLK